MTLTEQIRQREEALASAIAQRSIPAALALYTAEAQLLPEGAPTFKGWEEIARFFEGVFAQGVVAAKFVTLDVEGNASEASEVGAYELYAATSEGTVTVDRGRYLVLWRKVDGHWMIHRDMINHGPKS